MRFSKFFAVFFVIAAVLLLAGVSAVGVHNNGIGFNSDIASSSRKLKEVIGKGNYGGEKPESSGNAKLDDYDPTDPSPASKLIKPAPIEHGTPLMPFLPNPAPPPPQLGD